MTRTQSPLFALDEGGAAGGDLGDVFGAGQDEAVGAVGAGDRQVGDLVELTYVRAMTESRVRMLTSFQDCYFSHRNACHLSRLLQRAVSFLQL